MELYNTEYYKHFKCICDTKIHRLPCPLHFSIYDQDSWKLYKNYDSVLRTPININTNKLVDDKNTMIKINYSKCVRGHYIRTIYYPMFIVKDNNSCIELYEGNEICKKFVLRQFHFHNASENTIDEKFYPIEIHFVHEHFNIVTQSYDHLIISLLCNITCKPTKFSTIFSSFMILQSDDIELDLSCLNLLTCHNSDNTFYAFPGTATVPPFDYINYGWYLFSFDSVNNLQLSINKNVYNEFIKIFPNNRTKICDHSKHRYVEPLIKNFLHIKKIKL